MNKLWICGCLTKDPESRTTQTGKQVVSFTVAVNRRSDKNNADFFRVSAWGELGNNCQKYLSKGKRVNVTGQVSANAYTTRDGQTRASLEVFAEEVEFLSPAEKAQQEAPEAPKTDKQSGFVQVSEESLPF